MCGIIGYVGDRPCRDILFNGLRKLEYRGYDSAGISVLREGDFSLVRAVGNLDSLEALLAQVDDEATIGIAHTRWATHGVPSERNAHPHTDCSGSFAVVVNGIVENYLRLRAELVEGGHVFSSETDAEVVAHLLEKHYRGSFSAALRDAYAEMQGHFTIVAMSKADPDLILAVRKETPLVLGLGEGESFAASSVAAFMNHTRVAVFPRSGEFAEIRRHGIELYEEQGNPVAFEGQVVDWDEEAAEKGGFETFMLKEIHEQPAALMDTLAERVGPDGLVRLDGTGLQDEVFRDASQIVIVACGTSFHAGLLGKYALERWARLPVEIDVASEFRYRDPVLDERTICIAITQSGETADTLAAMRVARQSGARVLVVTNILGSQATREADGVLFTRAGLEIGVAATKTLLAQFLVLLLLALHVARVRGTLDEDTVMRTVAELRGVPASLDRLLAGDSPAQLQALARQYRRSPFFLYMGRNVGLPVCLEGALKLKEISYIPAESYAAGEMKHGPIALLTHGSPVVAVATDSRTYEKLVSNMQEVRARGAHVLAVASEGNQDIREVADHVIYVPATSEMVSPLLSVVPLQLFAYFVAQANGEKVDQPRNLAKTVTVE